MLVWWQKSKYEINYSHFFRGGWCGDLQWCNVRAHKIISASIIDFRRTLTYQSTSADLRQQRLTTFCAVCGVLTIILVEKGKHCGIFRGEGCNARDTYLFPLGWVFAFFNLKKTTKLGIVVHHQESDCHAKQNGILPSRSRSQCGLI